jgi:hypothetical protein
MTKKNLKGLNLIELQAFVEELGEKKYRAVSKGKSQCSRNTQIEIRFILPMGNLFSPAL